MACWRKYVRSIFFKVCNKPQVGHESHVIMHRSDEAELKLSNAKHYMWQKTDAAPHPEHTIHTRSSLCGQTGGPLNLVSRKDGRGTDRPDQEMIGSSGPTRNAATLPYFYLQNFFTLFFSLPCHKIWRNESMLMLFPGIQDPLHRIHRMCVSTQTMMRHFCIKPLVFWMKSMIFFHFIFI